MNKYLKCIKAFPLGNTVLLLSYLLVYAIDGNPRFASEINNLTEVKLLLAQVVFSGIVYVLTALYGSILVEFSQVGKKVRWVDLFKFLGGMVGILAVGLVASFIIDRRGSLQTYTGEIFVGITIILMIAAAIIYIIYNAVQNYKINKALVQKQASGKKKNK